MSKKSEAIASVRGRYEKYTISNHVAETIPTDIPRIGLKRPPIRYTDATVTIDNTLRISCDAKRYATGCDESSDVARNSLEMRYGITRDLMQSSNSQVVIP